MLGGDCRIQASVIRTSSLKRSRTLIATHMSASSFESGEELGTHDRVPRGPHLVRVRGHQGHKKLVLRAEQPVHGAGAHVGCGGDVTHGRRLVAAPAELAPRHRKEMSQPSRHRRECLRPTRRWPGGRPGTHRSGRAPCWRGCGGSTPCRRMPILRSGTCSPPGVTWETPTPTCSMLWHNRSARRPRSMPGRMASDPRPERRSSSMAAWIPDGACIARPASSSPDDERGLVQREQEGRPVLDTAGRDRRGRTRRSAPRSGEAQARAGCPGPPWRRDRGRRDSG